VSDCYCDYDPAVFYHKTDVQRAAKPHLCDECGAMIQVGATYENVFALWDTGYGPTTFKTCALCVELRDWVEAHVPCLCWAHGNLHEDLRNTVDDVWHETVGLKFGFLRRMVLIDRQPRWKKP